MNDTPVPIGPDDMSKPITPIAALQQRRERLTKERHTDLAVPGYGGDLVMRYRALDYEDLVEITDREDERKGAELATRSDVLIAAAVGAFWREERGELVPLERVLGDADLPVRFDARLAAATGFTGVVGSAREALSVVIPDDVAVTRHYVEYTRWRQNPDAAAVEDSYAGESVSSA